MYLSASEKNYLIAEIGRELGAKRDGGNKNLISRCPFCKKEGKFGVYIGKETEKKKLFMAHCFSCGYSTTTLEQLLSLIDRQDLFIEKVTDLSARLDEKILFPLDDETEIDDGLDIVELPDFYKRTFSHPYLKSRGFAFDDYEYYQVGTTGRLNYRFNDYVIFPITDNGDIVGYVARHIWNKQEIDSHNRKAKTSGNYRLLRYRNSTDNDFVKLLYNHDAIIENETDTVIIVEGIFDVIALTRKLELYDNTRIAVVATFGKKISSTQIFKLQQKGIETVIIGYDGDAVEAIKKTATELKPYFEVMITDIENPYKDWEDLSCEEIYFTFSYRLKTPLEYSLSKIQE